MIVLGIEGSANKIGIGIMKDDEILANERFTHITPAGTGFMPSETAAHHRRVILNLLDKALKKAELKITDIDLFAYTKGPGMAPCLMICAIVARILSLKTKKPLIGVNHCIAHIEMGRFITRAINPVILYVSGGNTQVIAYSNGIYRIFGETLDVAVGNCIDRVARILKLPNDPCPGYNVEMAARKGNNFVNLPVVIIGMDVSMSAVASQIEKMYKDNLIADLPYKNTHKESQKKKKDEKLHSASNTKKSISNPKTRDPLNQQIDSEGLIKDTEQVNKYLNNNTKQNFVAETEDCRKNGIENDLAQMHVSENYLPDSKITINDICFSLQECLFSALIEVTERAMAFVGSQEVLITGGVGCNKKLQNMMEIMVKERNGIVHATDEKFCIDNGLMIAQTGRIMHQSGLRHNFQDCFVTQRFRTDSVKVTWRSD